MRILLGLTGPTGAGKSIAAEVARKQGIKVLDCDLLAREAVLPGTLGLSAVTAAFGKEMLLPDGTLDRKRLAAVAFATPENTEKLNRVLLPHIADLVRSRLEGDKILLDAPTLFESGLDQLCTVTVAVLANENTRLNRIIERDALTAPEARTRLAAGKPDSFYIERADHVIYNNDGPNTFEFEVRRLLRSIYGGN